MKCPYKTPRSKRNEQRKPIKQWATLCQVNDLKSFYKMYVLLLFYFYFYLILQYTWYLLRVRIHDLTLYSAIFQSSQCSHVMWQMFSLKFGLLLSRFILTLGDWPVLVLLCGVSSKQIASRLSFYAPPPKKYYAIPSEMLSVRQRPHHSFFAVLT